ncbi:hypothetical protein GQ602_004341 [Ophiocordyceps camponoti-floridani]|uniref:DUF3669 domain-containing protein n=1 Tax=Ophiocordyceps camponoti-floridani TaxID=2030778 RepID=A0A8H4VDN9_9HYPO|nr:hypothetical protein GQ602_004341 [Ophiocordyceps camponoti-floridani]
MSHVEEANSLLESLHLLSDMPEAEAEAILQRTLSTQRVPATQSAFARRMNEERNLLNVIGRGTCGTVFEVPGEPIVIKIAGADGTASLWKDFILTNRAHEAVASCISLLRTIFPKDLQVPAVPAMLEFHKADNAGFWTVETAARFRSQDRTHINKPALIAGRIPPMPVDARLALIRKFVPEAQRKAMADDARNDACLVRPYMGANAPVNWATDSLENFPLHLNHMRALNLGMADLAREMGIGLAIMHWAALIDGSDVEFVLGTSITMPSVPHALLASGPANVFSDDLWKRTTHLYMLDFDKADEISLDWPSQQIIDRLVAGVEGNDRYYPRPELDAGLWGIFSRAYRRAADAIVPITVASRRFGRGGRGGDQKAKLLRLPRLFLSEWERVMEENAAWNPEEAIAFESGQDQQEEDEGWGSDDVFDDYGDSEEASEDEDSKDKNGG